MKTDATGKKKTRLLIECGGGLCNRLMALNSALQMADHYGIKDVTIVWRNHRELGCDFEDLFLLRDGIIVKDYYIGARSFAECLKQGRVGDFVKKLFGYLRYRVLKLVNRKNEISVAAGEGNTGSVDHREIQKAAEAGRNIYIHTARGFFGDPFELQVDIRPDIMSKAVAMSRQMGDYVGLHIRRTDHVSAMEHSSLDAFRKTIDRLIKVSSELNLYLATDDMTTYDAFLKAYPKNVFRQEKGAIDRVSTAGIQYALEELLVLSKAKKIYGSFESSYSLMAAKIGNIELEIVENDI